MAAAHGVVPHHRIRRVLAAHQPGAAARRPRPDAAEPRRHGRRHPLRAGHHRAGEGDRPPRGARRGHRVHQEGARGRRRAGRPPGRGSAGRQAPDPGPHRPAAGPGRLSGQRARLRRARAGSPRPAKGNPVSVAVHHVLDGPADGPVVVLSNSIGSTLHMWDPQVKPLVDHGFRVLRYDTRGHGRSPVPSGPYGIEDVGGDVLDLLDRLEIGAVHFVGLSLGGMTGIWLGQNAPERVRSLVLACTSAQPGNTQMWLDRVKQVRAEGMAKIAEGSIGRWFTREWIDAHPDEAAALREMTATTPAEGYTACCELLADLDLVPGLPKITAPTLVISGADDKALPPDHGRVIADGIAGARFEVVDHAAHLGSYEQAERFNQLILEHLEGVA
ncbi:3-oxoadipate enol-lactonase [Amycolatopsis bartoniae]|nr:3-oxoadipate enol-lactonase [Amycolatopsis bartoniae]